MICKDCVAKAKLRNRDMAGMLEKAKTMAIEEKKPKAICWEPIQGLFIADPATAIAGHFQIKHIVSGLHEATT